MSLPASEQFFLLMALGFATGVYGTLIGAGGGFVLMPVLLLLYPAESPERLTSISLAVVFFNALSGSEAYALMRRIDYRSGLLFAAAAVPGAVLGALNTSAVPRRLFDAVFGALLFAAAVYLGFRTSPEESPPPPTATPPRHHVTRRIRAADGADYVYSFDPRIGVGLSLAVGYVSSFLGIGGGIVHVPALTSLLHFPVHVATATSHFILAVMALTGTIVHVATGTFAHGVHRTVALALGVAVGAQVGAHLSTRVRGPWIMRGLAGALALVGGRILVLVFEGKP